VRGIEDTALDQSIFVHKYLNENLLFLVQKNLPLALTRRILKDVLLGLAALHDKDIVHNGRKAYPFQTARRWLINIRY
jgi:serine/threonine protein kinase